MDLANIIKNVICAAIATVGLEEWLKNFIKTEKAWIYALIMLPISIGMYCVCEYCPSSIIGSVITVGVVQICYQLIIQSIKAIVSNKFSNNENKAEIEGENNER